MTFRQISYLTFPNIYFYFVFVFFRINLTLKKREIK